MIRPTKNPLPDPLRGPFRSGLSWDGSAGGAWTPAFLGSKLKLWLDERGQSGNPIDSWTNQASGGIVTPIGVTTGRPAASTLGPYAAADFSPAANIMTSTSQLSALVSASSWWIGCVVALDTVTGAAADALAYNNNTIIADSGGFWGLHLKDEGSGLMRVQAYHWDGAAKVSGLSSVTVTTAPLVIQAWYDGSNLNLKVGSTTASTTAAGNLSTLTGTIRIGTGQVLRLDGRVGALLTTNAALTAGERASFEAWALRWGAPALWTAASTANLWGNGWTASTPTFWSSSAMMVAETDATSMRVRYRSAGSGIDPEYGACAVIRGATGARYGTTEEFKIPAQSVAGEYETSDIPLGGSGSRRIFAVGGCLSGFVGQHVVAVGFPASATTSIVTRDATTSVAIDGWGSMKCNESYDGFVVSGGVLSTAGADVTARAAYRTRIGNYGANECLICVGTNDGAAGTSSSDYEVGLKARIDEIIGAGIAAGSIWVMSPVKRIATLPSTEPAWMAGYRTAANNAATAKSTNYVDGSAYPTNFSDLGPDNVHPDPGTAEQSIADGILTATGTTGKLLIVGDSIMCGSTDPTDWNAARGVLARVRIGRI